MVGPRIGYSGLDRRPRHSRRLRPSESGRLNLDHLRERTRPEHEATETLLPVMSPDLTRAAYAGYLAGLYAAVGAWETYAAAHAPHIAVPLLQERHRAALLEQDLRALGAPVPALAPFDASRIPGLAAGSPPAFLGAMYVVEGSSLGGQYIARHLDSTLALTPGNGAAYFHGYGERTGALWNQFKSVLAALPDTDEDQVVGAALAMFALFADSLSVALPR
jgi:heme oxygenase